MFVTDKTPALMNQTISSLLRPEHSQVIFKCGRYGTNESKWGSEREDWVLLCCLLPDLASITCRWHLCRHNASRSLWKHLFGDWFLHWPLISQYYLTTHWLLNVASSSPQSREGGLSLCQAFPKCEEHCRAWGSCWGPFWGPLMLVHPPSAVETVPLFRTFQENQFCSCWSMWLIFMFEQWIDFLCREIRGNLYKGYLPYV